MEEKTGEKITLTSPTQAGHRPSSSQPLSVLTELLKASSTMARTDLGTSSEGCALSCVAVELTAAA